MQIITGQNFRKQNTTGALGVVVDTRYVRCYWPALDEPVALFEEGSSGIEVMGPPTPRNVVFPKDTVFLPIQVDDSKVEIVDGKLVSVPQWRDTDIPTRSDCYFTKAKELTLVDEEQSVTKAIEVEPGLYKEVQYSKPIQVSKEVDVLTELTVEEAKTYVGAK